MKIHLSANKLAAFLTASSPEWREAVVRTVWRSRGKSFPPFYSALRNPARRFAAGGWANPTELLELIAAMPFRQGSTWLNTDSKVTAEASQGLLALAPRLRDQPMQFILPPAGSKAVLAFPEIDVIATPDLLVQGVRGEVPLVGALRFYWAKDSAYALGMRGAELVAAMQHLWLVQNTSGNRAPDAGLCLVLECFQQRITAAPGTITGLEEFLRRGCADFLRYWNAFGGEEAA